MQQINEIERMFFSEIREKKKTASGVHHKTGKRGYVGKMLFPTDIMTRKEKYNHRKAGKVMTTNIFDDVLPIEEFNKLEDYEKKNRLQYWRNSYSNKEIIEKMSTNNAAFYKMIEELDLPKKLMKKSTTKRKAAATIQKETPAMVPEAPATVPAATIQEIMVEGLHLVYNGKYPAENIQKQLTKFITLLDGETDDFYIEMRMTQKLKKGE